MPSIQTRNTQGASVYEFQTAQLREFGLDPRDWLLRDSRTVGYETQKLQHRDDEDIQLNVYFENSGEIKEVELLIAGA